VAVLAFASSQAAGLISSADLLIRRLRPERQLGRMARVRMRDGRQRVRRLLRLAYRPRPRRRGEIGQIQLIQPLLTLAWSAALLGEHLSATTLFAAVLVLLCVVGTQRTRVDQAPLVTSQR